MTSTSFPFDDARPRRRPDQRLKVCSPHVLTTFTALAVLSIVLLVLAGSRRYTQDHSVAIPDGGIVRIEATPLDARIYGYSVLDNGLEAVLVSDPTAETAAAAVAIKTGAMDDPEEHAGLAHLLEHMLFRGSACYPGEDEYTDYLARHGGTANAETSLDDTVYHFSVLPGSLPGALDRFACSLTRPLIRADAVEREISAVDSEYRWRWQADGFRSSQIMRQGAAHRHPWSHFLIGNRQTLKAPLHTELRRFHHAYYSPSQMSLSIISNTSLSDLAEVVRAAFKSSQAEKPSHRHSWPVPFVGAQVQSWTFYRSNRDDQRLTIQWAIEDQQPLYDSKPAALVGAYISRLRNSTVASDLRHAGLIEALEAGPDPAADGFGLFSIAVILTLEGLARYEHVALAILGAVESMRQRSPESLRLYHAEQFHIAKLNHQYREVVDGYETVRSIARHMLAPVPRRKLLTAPYLSPRFDVDAVQRLFDQLNPALCRIFVKSASPPSGIDYDQVEPYFGIDYRTRPFAPFLADHIGQEFPPYRPNPFFPDDVRQRVSLPARATLPQLLRQDTRLELWYKQEDRFAAPRTLMKIALRTPLRYRTARHQVALRLYTDLVDEALLAQRYDASVAGFSYSLGLNEEGLILTLTGWTSDKLLDLLRTIVMTMTSDLPIDRFLPGLREAVRREYANSLVAMALYQAETLSIWLRDRHINLAEEKLAELHAILASDIEGIRAFVLPQLSMQVYLHGTLQLDDAHSVGRLLSQGLGKPASDNAQPAQPRDLVLRDGTDVLVRRTNDRSEDASSAIVITYQFASSDDRAIRVRGSLLARLLHGPLFHQLRILDEVGYLVDCTAVTSGGVSSLQITAQSEWHPADLDTRIERFLAWGRGHIAKMPEAELAQHREALASNWLKSFPSAAAEADYNFQTIRSGTYRFKQYQADAALVRCATRDELLAIYDAHILVGRTRAKLSVHVIAQRVTPAWLTSPVTHQRLATLIDTRPLIADVKAALSEGHDIPQQDRDLVRAALTRTVPDGVTLVEDLRAWRATLEEASQPESGSAEVESRARL